MVRLRRLCLLYVFLTLAFAVNISPSAAKDYPGIAQQIDEILADPVLEHGIQGVVVESLQDGKVIYERNRNLVFIPASNFKLLVSAAALDKLGPNFRYRTDLYHTGRITDDGVLQGDLVLRGGGDPTLSTEHLRAFVAAVKKAGIKKITGSVAVDETRFDGQRLGWGWSWDDESYYYSAQVSSLCLNENVVTVTVKPGKKQGAPVSVVLDPQTSYVTVMNLAKTGPAGSEKTVAVDRIRAKNVIRVVGSVPLDYKPEGPEESITVEEPALYAGTVFKELLAKSGIEVAGSVKSVKTPDTVKLIDSHSSEPLSKIISLLNKPSDNLIAEVLLKTLGAEVKGKGTVEAGIEVESEFLKSAGLDMSALQISDGSGLSRQNYISPHNLVALLKRMYRHPHSKLYIDSLPVAGVDGTLRRRMKGTPAEGNIKAKTGYVSRVCSLSGYLTTKGGEPLVFSILLNNHLCRNAPAQEVQNKICVLLAGLE